MGLGHTTTRFVHVQGTDSLTPYAQVNDEENLEVEDLDEIQAQSINLYWPRERCPLFKNDDIILVDSPGVDIDEANDAWIDDQCADADLFILVLNSESTLMMREKAFFHAVSKKLAKPNILILFNRWDCSDNEKDINKVKEQHLQRAAQFLAHELRVVQNEEEGKKLVFFISAKEMLEKSSHPDRIESWNQFCDFIEMCLNSTDQGCRYWPYVQSGKQLAIDLDNIQAKINQKAKTLFYDKTEEKIQAKDKMRQQKGLLETSKTNEDVDKMLDHVDTLTLDAYQQILDENLPQIVMDFQANLEQEQDFKENLISQVESEFAEVLKSNLSTQLVNYMQNSQYCIKQHFKCQNCLHLDPYLDFPTKFNLKEELFITKPVQFNFSLSPKNIQERFKGRKMFPFLNPISESWSSRLKILITAAAVINESQLAIAGLVLKCFGSSKAAIRIGTSVALIYCGLYLFERTVWALSGKEKQIKLATLAFATEKLTLLQSCVISSMKTQVRYQMKSFLDSLQANIESSRVELQEIVERIDEESDGIQFVIKSCANLSNSLQGVLFDFDGFERTLWNKMEKNMAKSPAKILD